MSSCSNCGAGVPAEAAWCPNCGTRIQQETPQQAQQTIGFARQSTEFRTSPTQQLSQPPGSENTVPAPPQVSTQAPSSSGLGGKVAVAAAVSFLGALGVGALIYFLVLSPGTDTAGGDQAQAGGGQAGTPTVHQKESHQLERLDKAVHQQVGDFRLQQVERVPPEAIEVGAIDDRIMVYTTTGGVSVTLFMTLFRDADMASTEAKGDIQSFLNDGYQKQGTFHFETSGGKKLGEGASLTRENEEVVVWSNGTIVGIIEAPKGEGVDFLGQLRY